MPKTIAELRDALGDPGASRTFSAGFARSYFGVAFGTLPKSELDLLVFGLLIEAGLIDQDGPIYDIARALNITPAKASNLLFQYQLRNAEEDRLNQLVLKTLAGAKFALDDKRVSFGVESPIVRATIAARMRAKGVFADTSLSGDILKVSIANLGEFIELFVTDAEAEKLKKQLKKAGAFEGGNWVEALNKFGQGVAKGVLEDAAKDAAKDAVQGMLGWVLDAVSGGDSPLPEGLSDMFGQA